MANEDGNPYRVVLLFSMEDVLHFATELSHHGYSYESARQQSSHAYDGVFSKDSP